MKWSSKPEKGQHEERHDFYELVLAHGAHTVISSMSTTVLALFEKPMELHSCQDFT